MIITLYLALNYYNMIYTLLLLLIFTMYVDYSLGACLLYLIMCASIASCLGGRCDCAMFLGILSGISKMVYHIAGNFRRD